MDESLAWLRDPELGHAAGELLCGLIARNRGPVTLLFERLASEPVRIEMSGNASRSLAVPECLELHAERGTCGIERAGILRTTRSGLAIAAVSSLVVPGRLPASALSALGIASADDPAPSPSDIPLGKVLARLGVQREPLGVRLVRDGVEASARMWLGDVPVALASERVTGAFCQRAAALAGAGAGAGAMAGVGVTPTAFGWRPVSHR